MSKDNGLHESKLFSKCIKIVLVLKWAFYVVFRESILLGYTSFTKDEVEQAVSHLGRDFKGISYHLMNKNCNHFASELSQVSFHKAHSFRFCQRQIFNIPLFKTYVWTLISCCAVKRYQRGSID